MKQKRLLALLTAMTMTASLMGCSGASTEGSGADDTTGSTTADTAGSSTDTGSDATASGDGSGLSYTSLNLDDYTDLTASIKFLHHKTDRQEDGTMDSMIAAFNEKFPNITVTTEAVTDYAEDALLRLSTGDWGDVMFVPEVDKTDYATYFMPLDTLDNLSQAPSVDFHESHYFRYFRTRICKEFSSFDSSNPVVELSHWGLSPLARGQGIVPLGSVPIGAIISQVS